MAKIHTLVTDENIPENYLNHFNEIGIKVIIADDKQGSSANYGNSTTGNDDEN
jgi:hypothetical protein